MTYFEKIESSESKAHRKNVATKILRDMDDLRAKVDKSPNTSRRWVWELIQNAKDVAYERGVRIKILQKAKDGVEYLEFAHDGKPFNADNLRFLIEQISSKEREKDEKGKSKQTGKFGTGFLTTHMLSEKVAVRGVAKEDDLNFKKFKFVLDRSGNDLDEIIAAVQKSKGQIRNLDELDDYADYKETDFNTTFIYKLSDNQSRTVNQRGTADLKLNLPFTLCFVDEIKSVEVGTPITAFSLQDEMYIDKNSEVKVTTISIDSTIDTQYVSFVVLSKGWTSILVPVEKNGDTFDVKLLSSDVPKIFCDFPLIGTESFPFPVVVNNPNFNPNDPRDGIYLTDSQRSNRASEENKEIMGEAVHLFFRLLDVAIESDWGNLHLFAKLGQLKEPVSSNTSEVWYETIIQNPIRKKLEKSAIVKCADGDLHCILQDNGDKYMWFPYGGTKEIRGKIWGLANHWFPHCLPDSEHIEFWSFNLWTECGKLTLDRFAQFIESKKMLSELSKCLKNIDVIVWLNKFYEMLSLDGKEFAVIIQNRAIVPNQNGDFEKRNTLEIQDGEINDTLKDILLDFKKDLRSRLVDNEIEIEFESAKKYSIDDAVREINAQVIEKTADREVAQDYRPALKSILNFFVTDPVNGKKLFPGLYSRKHILYDDEEIMININKAEELDDLLTEFNVSSADELRRKLVQQSTGNEETILPITQEILVSMGISNIEDWKNAMKDIDLQALFDHRSIPSDEMFVFAQGHIDKARKRVISHLQTLDDYDLEDLDESTATTVLAGITKFDRPVKIVFRPAYKNEVIIYYGAEKHTLDVAEAELWVDDGKEVWQVTLGHIIKKNNIRKFPI